jgi:hypothetical protein
MEGATSKIVNNTGDPSFVCKIYKRSVRNRVIALRNEKAFHARIAELIPRDSLIKVPVLKVGDQYCMKRIDTSRPLWDDAIWNALDDPAIILREMHDILIRLAENRLVLRDTEAYLQPDGSIALIDFGQVYELAEPYKKGAPIPIESAALLPSRLI